MLKLTPLIPALLIALATPALADMVRCKDANGKVYYSDKPPPECAKQAKDRLGSSGVVRSHEQGELTPEERARQEAKKKADDAEKRRLVECRNHNRALIVTYNSAEEIDAAREKALRQAEATIAGIQKKIADTQELQAKLQAEANSYKGKPIPADLKASIARADQDLRSSQQLVLSARRDMDGIRTKFADDKRQYLAINAPGATEASVCPPGAKTN
jgi:uncharacterized protein DUF4124